MYIPNSWPIVHFAIYRWLALQACYADGNISCWGGLWETSAANTGRRGHSCSALLPRYSECVYDGVPDQLPPSLPFPFLPTLFPPSFLPSPPASSSEVCSLQCTGTASQWLCSHTSNEVSRKGIFIFDVDVSIFNLWSSVHMQLPWNYSFLAFFLFINLLHLYILLQSS